MAALADVRNTLRMLDIQRSPLPFPQKASTTIYQGSLVALNAGYAAPGATATGLIVAGRAKKTTVNAGADGSTGLIEIEEGIFKWDNSGGDPVVAADVGSLCYITDDHTVCHTSTGKSSAGKVIQLDSDGVWVKSTV